MTVYVVQASLRYNRDTGEYERVHDLTPAKEYGELSYLLSPSAAPWNTDGIVDDLWTSLQKFTEDDYLLMIGNPVLIGLAAAIAAQVSGGRLRFLQWSGKDRRYIPIEVQLFDLDPVLPGD